MPLARAVEFLAQIDSIAPGGDDADLRERARQTRQTIRDALKPRRASNSDQREAT